MTEDKFWDEFDAAMAMVVCAEMDEEFDEESHQVGEVSGVDNEVDFLRRKAEAGDTKIQMVLARFYLTSSEDENELAQAREWLRQAAERGDELAQKVLENPRR